MYYTYSIGVLYGKLNTCPLEMDFACVSYCLVLVNDTGVGNIDTVEELTDILMANKDGLVDKSG